MSEIELCSLTKKKIQYRKRKLNILFFSSLDPPVQLSTIPIKFPVKLTDPVTAVLYITSDYQHMQELKHTIHVKAEVVHGKNYFSDVFPVPVLLLKKLVKSYFCLWRLLIGCSDESNQSEVSKIQKVETYYYSRTW